MKKLLFSLGLLIAMLFQFTSSDAQVFPGTTIADPSDNAVMTNWIGNNPGGTLLYRRSRDGANSYTFHNLSDNQGATVVLIKTANGTVFGGYASESWLSNYGYIQANNSFLFNLTTDQRVLKGGYNGANNSYGLYSNSSYGPTFGSGHDLYIGNDMNSGYINIGNAYNTFTNFGAGSAQEIEAFVGTGLNGSNSIYNGFITEIEVYKITLNYSTPVVLGRNIKRYIDNSGVVNITASMIDSASTDPDGIASISIDKTSFDCSSIGAGSAIPIVFTETRNQNTNSYGGGYNPNTNQFYYPQWADPTIYVYNNDGSFVNTINTNQYQMMQVWMNSGSNDIFTANWGYNTYSRISGSTTVWTYNANYTAGAISSDGVYVYAKEYTTNFIRVLDINTGAQIRTINLPGYMYHYGGMVVANNLIYIAGNANGFGTYTSDWRAIHVFNMDGTYISSTPIAIEPASMAYDGETMWISNNNNVIYGYKISEGNTYTSNGVGGSSVRLTVTDNLGNVGFKDYSVQLLDTILPSIALNGNSIEVAALGGPWNDPNVTATDNCPKPVTITGTVDVNTKGIYSLSYRMKDAGGNFSNTLNRTVYVGAYDTTAPTAIAKNYTLNLAQNTSGTFTATDIDNGSFDANGLKSITISNNQFDCSDIGVQTVQLTVEDYYGHTATANAQVNVVFIPQYTISQNSTCVFGNEGTAEISTSSSGVGSNLYYGTTGNQSGGTRLVTFDPLTGAATTVGFTGTSGMPAVAVNSLGEIYGTTGYDLYSLDKNSGYATYIRSIYYCSVVSAMTFKNDLLYVLDRCGYLYTVDIVTGTQTQVMYTGNGYSGIQFDPTDGTLWATDRSYIYKIDISTNSIYNIGYTGYTQISDLVFNSQGTLYAIQGGGGGSQILLINKNDGSATFQANTISNIAGAASGGGSLNFSWSNGQTGAKATNLVAGTYTVTITGAQGCSTVDTVVFAPCAPIVPVVTLQASDSVLCNNNTGAITLTANATTTLPASSQNTSVNDANLVAYYKFDETSGTTVSDNSSNNLNGSFAGNGSSFWTSSTAFTGSNNALSVGGYGSYVQVPDNNAFNAMQNAFTIEAWIKPTDNDNNTIVDRAAYNFLFQANPHGQQGLGFYNQSIGWYYDNTYIPTNQWSHVAVTWDGSTYTLKFYVNGALTTTYNVGYNLYFNAGNLNIGRQDPNGCQCNFMDGAIDELRLWKTTRTQSEIQNNLNSVLGGAVTPQTHTYVWSPATGLNTTAGEVVIATPTNTTTYTVTATNSSGASSSISQTIVVNQLASNIVTANGPINVCPGNAVSLQADNSGAFTYQWNYNGTPLLNSNNSTYNAMASGSYTVDITSAPGCTVTSLPVNITVADTENPVVLTQNISRTITSSTGAITITAADINNGSYDNCSIASITVLGNNVFDCNTVSGVYPIVLSITDGSGNSASQSANITITNSCNTAPVAICKSITIPTVASTNTANASAIDFNNGSTDAENDVLSFTVSPAGPYALGTTNVVLTVSDPAGLSSTCNASITVIDNENPIVVTKNATVYLNANGNGSINVNDVNDGSSDNDAIATLVLNTTTFTCLNIGANTVSLTATDAANNTSTTNATVTVVDNTAPIAIAQNLSINLDATGNASITATEVNNGSTDNCSIANISIDKTTFNCSNLGANTVVLTITDGSGNTSTANATVTVVDNTAPTAIAQNLSINLDATGNASITATEVNNGSTDNCSIANISIDKTTFNCSNLGANTVVLTITDGSGNTSTANATVTVIDNTAPVAIAQNLSINLDATGNASITATDVNNGSTDNCSIANISIDKTTFNCSNLGANTVVLTITDGSGNTSTANATVTVIDNTAPVAIAQNLSINLDATGNASITATEVNNGSTDNCSIANISIDKTSFDCTNVGANTVVLTITDGSGNTSTANATVTVIDNTAPVAIAQNLSINLDGTGNASITATDVNNGSTDNCAIANISIDKTTFNCSNLGANTVVLTITDGSGNTSTANATVTVIDNTAPVAIAQNLSINLDATGNASITATDVNNGSTDNCSIANISIDKTSFDCTNVGANTVVLTITDGSGNTSTANATITVIDNTAPVAIAQNLSINLDATGNASITATEVNNGSTDNCSIANISIDKTTFNCSNLGANTVVLTITDGSGNTSTANATVTVVDNIAPIINAVVDQSKCIEPSGVYTIENITASDNCAIVSSSFVITGATNRMGSGLDASGAFNLGLSTITWAVSDASNNTSTFSTTVTINALPTVAIVNSGNNAFCNEITLTANTNGAAIANYMWSNGATTESITLDASDADGLYTVYVIDVNGCNNAVAASFNYQKQNLANTYTILAYDEVELHENNVVQSGSIGIMSSRGEAEFKKNVSVTGAGSFVKSPRIKTSGSVNIPNRITGVANVTLPTNYNNNASTRNLPSYTVNQYVTKVLNGNYKEVTIKKGAIVTLNGTIYGKISIEEGARVTITSSIVNIDELKVGKGKNNAITRLNFNGNTSLLIEDKVKIEENCIVNDQNHVVTFYFGNASGCGDNDEDKFSVEGGNTSVVANVMIPQGKIKAKSSSNNAVYLTGLFVADKVKSEGKNIYWNNFSCSVSNSNKVTETSEELPVVLEENMFNLVAFPNPALEVFSYKLETLNEEKVSFKLYDVQGRLISETLDANPNETYKAGEQLAPGVYMLEATQGTERKVLRVVKTQ